MARSDARFRKTYNAIIERYLGRPQGTELPTETELASEMAVSRTVIRSVLHQMERVGIAELNGRQKLIVREPVPSDKLSVRSDVTTEADLESVFLDWVLRFDVPAGTTLNVAQMSRDFNVSPHVLQEFLANLRSFGLVERRAGGGWTLLGFTAEFAVELSELRAVLELSAIERLLACPADHPVWQRLAQLRTAHLSLAERIETDYHDFSKLDEQFHSAINSVVRNRFVLQFQRVISLIFHYHYTWDKRDEKARNTAAIQEHLDIIDALQARDHKRAVEAARSHLKTSTTTLLSSLRSHNLV